MADVNGSNGGDVLIGTRGRDDIDGYRGNDVLIGGAGHDVMNGGKGNDVIIGGSGNDWLEGDQGSDILVGGAGRDAFILNQLEAGVDIVIDFTKNQDRIHVQGVHRNHIGFVDRYDAGRGGVQYARSDGAFYGARGIFGRLARAQALDISDFF